MKSIFLGIALLISSCVFAQSPTDYVNPFIGTDNDGQTNPGALLPWGMMCVSPFNGYDTLKTDKIDQGFGASMYHKPGRFISGFGHAAVSGPGCAALGVMTIMPTHLKLTFHPKKFMSPYSDEVATPGYYKTMLTKSNIKVEMTATERCAMHRYTFPQGEHTLLLNNGLCLTLTKGGMIQYVADNEFEGYHANGEFCGKWVTGNIYYVIKIEKKPLLWGMWSNQKDFKMFKRENVGNDVGAYLNYETQANEQILVKVAISYTSIANARLNMEKEMPDWDFEKYKKQAAERWNHELSKIKVEGGTDDDKTMFYTGLYHCLIHPNLLNDVNGEYPATGSFKTTKAIGYQRYTLYSLWDTYRNLHPFLSLVYPEQQSDMVKSMLAMYQENGWLPKWELASQETLVMVGDPSLPVIADTYLRGIRDFDINLAYQAMLKGATTPEANNPLRPGMDSLLKNGFIPEKTPKVWGSVATAQEYGIADWNLAQISLLLKKDQDFQKFSKQALYHRNYFKKDVGFFCPRIIDGSFFPNFDPHPFRKSVFPGAPGFVEGDAWQYLFFVPHDMLWLKEQLGGDKKFADKLQKCMDSSYFSMVNEPDIAYPYLFNYCKGMEQKTQFWVRNTLRRYYNNSPSGLPGNDDCGVMSAWLLYSMMGFYPDCPGNMDYQLTSPVFDKITIQLNPKYYKGKEFVITAKNQNEKNLYIQSMQLNGKPHKKYTLNHVDIVNGGRLNFELSDK